MRLLSVLILIVFVLIPNVPDASTEEKTLLGFSEKQAAEQFALEARFDSQLKAQNLKEWMQRLAARPHHSGSPYGKENAEFMAGLFRSWGYQTEIDLARFYQHQGLPMRAINQVKKALKIAPEHRAANELFGTLNKKK